ncbi:MAG: glycosyltransferase family 1 protein [Pseudomonadota bacterium]
MKGYLLAEARRPALAEQSNGNIAAIDSVSITPRTEPMTTVRRIALVTDAWLPQTNGVVTTLRSNINELEERGCEVFVIHPGLFSTIPLPSYPEIRIALNAGQLKHQLLSVRPDSIHIATEGPLGFYARRFLAKRRIPFTTSIHTKFPEYINERIRLPISVGYRFMRWFHKGANVSLCTTETHRKELEGWGFRNLRVWRRGVDTKLFRPQTQKPRNRPKLYYIGRIAVEKSVEDFLDLPEELGDKIVVGDGPQRASLEKKYPNAQWLGYKRGEVLATAYADADVFVFPSRTDTFGLVMLEAMACGTPVAAYPVTGPIDVVEEGLSGSLHTDLKTAVEKALKLDRTEVRRAAEGQSWSVIAERFLEAQQFIDWNSVGS